MQLIGARHDRDDANVRSQALLTAAAFLSESAQYGASAATFERVAADELAEPRNRMFGALFRRLDAASHGRRRGRCGRFHPRANVRTRHRQRSDGAALPRTLRARRRTLRRCRNAGSRDAARRNGNNTQRRADRGILERLARRNLSRREPRYRRGRSLRSRARSA